jgi:hypothetical protein
VYDGIHTQRSCFSKANSCSAGVFQRYSEGLREAKKYKKFFLEGRGLKNLEFVSIVALCLCLPTGQKKSTQVW